MLRIYISFFLLGVSLGSGPCMVSCGPLLVSYVAGTGKNIGKSILVYLLFSTGKIIAYILLGLLIFRGGQIAMEMSTGVGRYIYLIGGLFLILIGILLALKGKIENRLCGNLQGFFLKKDIKTVLAFGLIIGFLPCAPLVSVLAYIALISKTWANNSLYSFSFGLGTLFSPLLIIIVLAGLLPRLTRAREKLFRWLNLIGGLVIVFLGLQLVWRFFG